MSATLRACRAGHDDGKPQRPGGARLLELRAATDLARLHAAQGQPVEARQVLAPVYASFTEEADSADVQEARAALASLDG